jgi:hypothetical protein
MPDPNDASDAGTDDNAAGWQTAVRGVVDAFVSGVGETTKQLGSAAEQFASETLRLMEGAAARIEEALARNGELSRAAERSAEDARSAAAAAAQDALAAANERFNSESARLLEQMAANIEQSTARSNELADLVERSVEQARQAVDAQIEAAMSGAGERLRAESRGLLDEIDGRKRQADEELTGLQSATDEARAALESMSSAFEARASEIIARLNNEADSALRRMTEMNDYAQRAADSARFSAERAADGGGATSTGADSGILDDLRLGIEETLGRASEMTAAAERAAEAARAAAEDARASVERSHASEGSGWAPENATSLLDRLEADYSLLTTVVQELSARIASLSSLAPPPVPASPAYEQTEGVAAAPAAAPEAAPLMTELPEQPRSWETSSPVAEAAPQWPDEPEAPAAAEEPPSYPWQSPVAEAEPQWPAESAMPPPAKEQTSYAWPSATPVEPPRAEVYYDIEEGVGPEPEEAPEASPRLVDLSFPAYAAPVNLTDQAVAEEPVATILPFDQSSAEPASWPYAPDTEAPSYSAPAAEPVTEAPSYPLPAEWVTGEVETEAAAVEEEPSQPGWPAYLGEEPVAGETLEIAEAEAAPAYAEATELPESGAEAEPSGWPWSAEEPPVAIEAPEAAPAWPAASLEEAAEPESPVGEPAAAEPVSAGERIEGRVTLNVSPITDFDRLLSLDGALGRLPIVRNVTLADYARDEVTFRIELGEPVSVDEFARNLSETTGQSILPVSVSEGHVRLQFTGIAA